MNKASLSYRAGYQDALHYYLNLHKQAADNGTKQGVKARTLGISGLEICLAHETAMKKIVGGKISPPLILKLTSRSDRFLSRALDANCPTQGKKTAHKEIRGLMRKLILQDAQIFAGKRRFEKEVQRRKSAEIIMRKSKVRIQEVIKKFTINHQRLKLLTRGIFRRQEEDKKSISRELHDVVGQMLSSLNFRLAAMKKESVTNTSILRSRIEAIQQVIRDTASVVQNFARDLRPSLLDDLGLLPAIRSYGSSFSSRTGIKIIYKLCQLNASIIPEISTVLFRIIQEALTNVERHARASQVEISLRKTPRSLWLNISDDGRGFDVSRYYNGHRPKKRLSLGLLGMRERAEMVGGSFNIQSAKGTPTVIEVRVPVFETGSIEPEPNKKTNVKFPT